MDRIPCWRVSDPCSPGCVPCTVHHAVCRVPYAVRPVRPPPLCATVRRTAVRHALYAVLPYAVCNAPYTSRLLPCTSIAICRSQYTFCRTAVPPHCRTPCCRTTARPCAVLPYCGTTIRRTAVLFLSKTGKNYNHKALGDPCGGPGHPPPYAVRRTAVRRTAVLLYCRTPYCRTPYTICRTPYRRTAVRRMPYAVRRMPYAVLPYAVRRTLCRTRSVAHIPGLARESCGPHWRGI